MGQILSLWLFSNQCEEQCCLVSLHQKFWIIDFCFWKTKNNHNSVFNIEPSLNKSPCLCVHVSTEALRLQSEALWRNHGCRSPQLEELMKSLVQWSGVTAGQGDEAKLQGACFNMQSSWTLTEYSRVCLSCISGKERDGQRAACCSWIVWIV